MVRIAQAEPVPAPAKKTGANGNHPRNGLQQEGATQRNGRTTTKTKQNGTNGHAQAAAPTRANVEAAAVHRNGTAHAAPDAVGIRTFVLDTNILLHNPDAVFVFKEHHVVIPFTVIEELDKMKRKDDDLGRNARACIRNLDRLRAIGKLSDGVNWGELPAPSRGAFSAGPGGITGTVKIDVADYPRPKGIDLDAPDNRIIAVAWHLHTHGANAVFVTKDLAARIKSDALGITTEDFANQRVDADRLYTGFVTASVETAIIDELYRDRLLALDRLDEPLSAQWAAEQNPGTSAATLAQDAPRLSALTHIVPNQFIVLKDAGDDNHTGLARRLADTDHVIPVTGPRKPVFGIMARNVQQTMAMDVLLDEDIKLITLLGSAGTGKTLLALAAGMTKVFAEERYDKLLVARPIMPLGRDIGFLPGDKDEKLAAWMQPIFDNLSYLLSTRGGVPARREPHGGAADQQVDGGREVGFGAPDLHPRPLHPAPVHDRG